ncbi:hypothetical protein F2Q69_00049088 [Brassica cretica]|uniref:Uncharacterized protein n=1 Tax=Brassica cretica TaxID=69181 RepID=A0A8S9PSC4_BRACR|nr:hypothetical protein F2Q69_00049088 [Brassica cretica]
MLRFSGPVARAGYCLPRYVVVDLRTTISVATRSGGCGGLSASSLQIRAILGSKLGCWWFWWGSLGIWSSQVPLNFRKEKY